MPKSLKTKLEYKHFLRYNQVVFDDFEYGFTDLFYDIQDSTLFIKKVDQHNNTEKELEVTIETKNASCEAVLEDFLINLMSFRGNFEGAPQYESSEIFSKESFDTMQGKGIALMDAREKFAILMNSHNDLINYCKSIGLSPEPIKEDTTQWIAQCPSGGHHNIMISTKSNQWGCGYCKKKGDLTSLKIWHNRAKVLRYIRGLLSCNPSSEI